jgi:hypothetical protein
MTGITNSQSGILDFSPDRYRDPCLAVRQGSDKEKLFVDL